MNLNVNYKKSKLKMSASVLAIAATLGMFGDVMGMDPAPKDGDTRNVDGQTQIWNATKEKWKEKPTKVVPQIDQSGSVNLSNLSQDFILDKDSEFPIFHKKKPNSSSNSTAIYTKNDHYNPDERRLLSLDGGGIRGLLEIMELAVLENIMNDPINDDIRLNILKKNFGFDVLDLDKNQNLGELGNLIHKRAFELEQNGTKADAIKKDFERRITAAKNNKGRMPVYIRDFFDAAAGTSTGSILAAGLFTTNANYLNQENLTTIDIAKLYYRYGKEVFDKHFNSVTGRNIFQPKYHNTGLKEMLVNYFADCKINDVYKPLFVVSCSDKSREVVVFGADKKFETIKLTDATLSSASAPTFFPSHVFKTAGSEDEYAFSDGGVKANNPCVLALEKFQKNDSKADNYKEGQKYGIYSLGTGDTAYTSETAKFVNAGLATIAMDITPYMMEMDLKERCTSCISSVETRGNPLETFVRLNPKLAPGKDLLDVTTPDFIKYMTNQAFAETEGVVFKNMCHKLGLKVPGSKEIKNIQKNVIFEMNQLTFGTKPKVWESLSELEKDYVFSKISENDFDFYEDLKKGLGNDFKTFFDSFTAHFKKQLLEKSYVSNVKDYGYYTFSEYNPLQKLTRGAAFHALSNDVNKVAPLKIEDLNSLKDLTVNPVVVKDGLWGAVARVTGGKTRLTQTGEYEASNPAAFELAKSVYLNFITCLDTLQKNQPTIYGETADYTSSSGVKTGLVGGNYVDFLAAVYIKDILRYIQHDVTKDQLEDLYKALIGPVQTTCAKGNFVWGNRVLVLATELRTYIDTKFPKNS